MQVVGKVVKAQADWDDEDHYIPSDDDDDDDDDDGGGGGGGGSSKFLASNVGKHEKVSK